MVDQSAPPNPPLTTTRLAEGDEIDADIASGRAEPVRPAEAQRSQLMRLIPAPARMATIGGCIASLLVGGAVGYWIGRRHASRPVRPIKRAAETAGSAVELVPVAMHLLANPAVQRLALRMLMRQRRHRAAA
jgi:hypothetical protein